MIGITERGIMSREEAIEELRIINNNLTLYMKKKRALQSFIDEENDRLKNINSPRSRAWELKKDEEFIKEHGRERTAKEIARLMHYSERQIQRFLKDTNF